MKKLIIPILCFVAVPVTGCSNWLPAVYEVDVQQGNIVEQENLNRVRPGMSPEQVRYLLGSPLVADPFRQDRWDYYYSLRANGDPAGRYRVSLFFENGRLARLEGDRHPDSDAAGEMPPRDTSQVVEIHPEPPKERGIITRLLSKIGIGA